ncbi:YlxR family protein [Vallicoccus soli]|uniref:YlxR family protein n=1 Tax=Vallicoccus soli TaxID=2339232 RepID=A0A3A3ZKX5_9ACTN|nr:YlxR family protein [Vallicoccus soli]
MGCRVKAPRDELLRLVLVEVEGARTVVPDPRGRLPGRGASLHPDPGCLELAERRRAFPRAFRLQGPLDATPVRRALEARAAGGQDQQHPHDQQHRHDQQHQHDDHDQHRPPSEAGREA